MKIQIANLADFITQTVAQVKAGVVASQAGGMVRLPKQIKFSVEVVRSVNALTRTTVENPGVTRTATGTETPGGRSSTRTYQAFNSSS